MTLLTS